MSALLVLLSSTSFLLAESSEENQTVERVLASIASGFDAHLKTELSLALKTVGSGDALAEILLEKSSKAISKGDLSIAERTAEATLLIEDINRTNYVSALRLKGSANLRSGQFDRAIANFGSALDFEPNDIFSLWQRCWAATSAGYFLIAEIDCDRARLVLRRSKSRKIQYKDSQLDEYVVELAAGNLEAAQGDHASALRSFRAAQRVMSPGSDENDIYLANLELHIGSSQHALGMYHEALDTFDVAHALHVRLGIEPAEVFYQRGLTYMTMGLPDEATEDLLRAFNSDQTSSAYAYAACISGLDGTMSRQTLRACERLLEIEPEDAQVYGLYGKVLVEAGDNTGAVEVIERGLRLNPTNRVLLEEAASARALLESE